MVDILIPLIIFNASLRVLCETHCTPTPHLPSVSGDEEYNGCTYQLGA